MACLPLTLKGIEEGDINKYDFVPWDDKRNGGPYPYPELRTYLRPDGRATTECKDFVSYQMDLDAKEHAQEYENIIQHLRKHYRIKDGEDVTLSMYFTFMMYRKNTSDWRVDIDISSERKDRIKQFIEKKIHDFEKKMVYEKDETKRNDRIKQYSERIKKNYVYMYSGYNFDTIKDQYNAFLLNRRRRRNTVQPNVNCTRFNWSALQNQQEGGYDSEETLSQHSNASNDLYDGCFYDDGAHDNSYDDLYDDLYDDVYNNPTMVETPKTTRGCP